MTMLALPAAAHQLVASLAKDLEELAHALRTHGHDMLAAACLHLAVRLPSELTIDALSGQVARDVFVALSDGSDLPQVHLQLTRALGLRPVAEVLAEVRAELGQDCADGRLEVLAMVEELLGVVEARCNATPFPNDASAEAAAPLSADEWGCLAWLARRAAVQLWRAGHFPAAKVLAHVQTIAGTPPPGAA